MRRPATQRELWAFIGAHFGVWLPFRVFTPGNSSPFAFVADAFFHPSADLAAWASRSGGKTLGASIIAALAFLFADGLQARVLAGSEDQAKYLYEYWQQWAYGILRERVESAVTRRLTRIAGGKMEILTASQKRIRGPKVQILFEEELDEISAENDAAAIGMIDSRPGEGLPGRTYYTSTWHRTDGLMGKLVDACPDNGVRLHRWNLWESIANCPAERHDEGRGCENCPLEPACRAKEREYCRNSTSDCRKPQRRAGEVGIASEAHGFYSVDDAIKAFRKASHVTWESEFLCKRPSAEGLVYPDFDELPCRCDKPPEHLTIYRAIDWGWGVFVCLWLGVAKDQRVYVLDTYRAEHGTLRQHAEFILAHRVKDVQATYCDPAGRSKDDQTGRSKIEVFQSLGVPCRYTLAPRLTNVHNGIDLVRSLVRSASGERRLFYAATEGNRMFVKAMHSYRNRKVNDVWIDDPQDPQEWEHIPDALRYFAVNRMAGRAAGVVKLGAR